MLRRAPWARAIALGAAMLTGVPTAARQTTVRPVPLVSTSTTLPNGLQVVFLEDHALPIVHVAIWYHVGSKDERPGRTGFAHVFEHLMFKGSKNVPADAHASRITGIGGEANAETDEDATLYWETVPSEFLPLVLWLEADRMASLDVSEEKFKTEVEIVKEERRMRIDNQPYGRLPELISEHAFTTHPYRHPAIGSIADLDAATIQDAREFHRRYYVPNNAVAVVAGDFAADQAKSLVEQYLGRVPRGEPIVRDVPAEPAHTTETRATVAEPWPLAAVAVAFHIPPDGHPDAYPLHVLAKILADGDSSRLSRDLVDDRPLALAVYGQAKLTEDPNLFYAVAIVQPDQPPDGVLAALEGELDAVRSGGVTAAELVRAKRQLARDYVLGRETLRQRARELGRAVLVHHDVRAADAEFDRYESVTAADVQRVARAYFAPESRLLLTVSADAAGAAR